MSSPTETLDPMDWKRFELVKRELARPPGDNHPFGFFVDERPNGIVLVRDVKAGSFAANAGLVAGDIIFAVNGKRATTKTGLAKEVMRENRVRFTIFRRRAETLDPDKLRPIAVEPKAEKGYTICRLDQCTYPQVGVGIGPESDHICVVSVIPNGAGSAAGLRANDRIIAVNNEMLAVKDREKFKKIVAEAKGDVIDLLVERVISGEKGVQANTSGKAETKTSPPMAELMKMSGKADAFQTAKAPPTHAQTMKTSGKAEPSQTAKHPAPPHANQRDKPPAMTGGSLKEASLKGSTKGQASGSNKAAPKGKIDPVALRVAPQESTQKPPSSGSSIRSASTGSSSKSSRGPPAALDQGNTSWPGQGEPPLAVTIPNLRKLFSHGAHDPRAVDGNPATKVPPVPEFVQTLLDGCRDRIVGKIKLAGSKSSKTGKQATGTKVQLTQDITSKPLKKEK